MATSAKPPVPPGGQAAPAADIPALEDRLKKAQEARKKVDGEYTKARVDYESLQQQQFRISNELQQALAALEKVDESATDPGKKAAAEVERAKIYEDINQKNETLRNLETRANNAESIMDRKNSEFTRADNELREAEGAYKSALKKAEADAKTAEEAKKTADAKAAAEEGLRLAQIEFDRSYEEGQVAKDRLQKAKDTVTEFSEKELKAKVEADDAKAKLDAAVKADQAVSQAASQSVSPPIPVQPQAKAPVGVITSLAAKQESESDETYAIRLTEYKNEFLNSLIPDPALLKEAEERLAKAEAEALAARERLEKVEAEALAAKQEQEKAEAEAKAAKEKQEKAEKEAEEAKTAAEKAAEEAKTAKEAADKAVQVAEAAKEKADNAATAVETAKAGVETTKANVETATKGLDAVKAQAEEAKQDIAVLKEGIKVTKEGLVFSGEKGFDALVKYIEKHPNASLKVFGDNQKAAEKELANYINKGLPLDKVTELSYKDPKTGEVKTIKDPELDKVKKRVSESREVGMAYVLKSERPAQTPPASPPAGKTPVAAAAITPTNTAVSQAPAQGATVTSAPANASTPTQAGSMAGPEKEGEEPQWYKELQAKWKQDATSVEAEDLQRMADWRAQTAKNQQIKAEAEAKAKTDAEEKAKADAAQKHQDKTAQTTAEQTKTDPKAAEAAKQATPPTPTPEDAGKKRKQEEQEEERKKQEEQARAAKAKEKQEQEVQAPAAKPEDKTKVAVTGTKAASQEPIIPTNNSVPNSPTHKTPTSASLAHDLKVEQDNMNELTISGSSTPTPNPPKPPIINQDKAAEAAQKTDLKVETETEQQKLAAQQQQEEEAAGKEKLASSKPPKGPKPV